MLTRWMISALILSLISGCATKVVPGNFCEQARAIFPSRDDVLTQETKRQILQHNEMGAALCGWSPSPRPDPVTQ